MVREGRQSPTTHFNTSIERLPTAPRDAWWWGPSTPCPSRPTPSNLLFIARLLVLKANSRSLRFCTNVFPPTAIYETQAVTKACAQVELFMNRSSESLRHEALRHQTAAPGNFLGGLHFFCYVQSLIPLLAAPVWTLYGCPSRDNAVS